ncbi:hypothetical protein CHS0354_001663 [Potamilus streckersoni]|uniref:Ricin B lectin domain-containing protein n=1 Tax=Potamilus streckersoni TaxID=2493646 RepID=A0AAE0RTW5_9BIVA|nr:hypothetical protein CHS0354_001663 [Potamilus streckersoni]
MMASKRKKRLAFVMSCLFLLQEFNMVFLLNIEEMRTSSTRVLDVSESSNEKSKSSKKTSDELSKVLEAIQSYGNHLKASNNSIVEHIKTWIVDCKSTDEMAANTFWRGNPTFSFIYTIISSALYYIAECYRQMEQKAIEIVDTLGYKTTIQIIIALTEFDGGVSTLNDAERHMNESSSTEQKPDDDANLDPEVLSNVGSNVLQILSINLHTAREVNGIFNALADNFATGNKTELEDMLQYASESSMNEILNDSFLEDVAETENHWFTANIDDVQTKLETDENELESQKSLLDKNAISSNLDRLKSQLSPLIFSDIEPELVDTLNDSFKTLKPDTINAYQDLLEIDSSIEAIGKQTRKKRAADIVQHYIMYISSNPCFVMTSSKDGNFSEFKRFADLLEQEWRYDLKHLINYHSGLALSVDTFSRHFEKIMMLAEPDWNAESQSWDIDNENRLLHSGSKNCRLDIYNGYVSVYCNDSQPLIEIELVPYLEYKRIHWQKKCDSIETFEYFFMKSSNSIHACKVLTVTDPKEHLTYQEVFDRDISWQLWRVSNGYIVNMGSGLNLHLRKSGLKLIDLNRIISLDNEKSKVWNDSLHITVTQKEICQPLKYDIDIDYIDINASLECCLYSNYDTENADTITCQDTKEMNMIWTYITLENARNDLESIACFYILSNANYSCELMIVDGIQNNVSILAIPEMEQMVQGAGLWYISENHLIHAGTGLALASEVQKEFPATGLTGGILRRRVDLDDNQLWLLVGREISTLYAKMRLTMESQITSRYTSEWLVSERHAFIENDMRKGCHDHRTVQSVSKDNQLSHCIYDYEQSHRFLIRNKVSACKFLRGSGTGFPDVKYFATHAMEKYIWIIQNGLIMHEDTSLFLSSINWENPHLMLNPFTKQNTSESSQKWIVNGNRISSKHNDSCEIGLLEPNSDKIGLFCNESEIAHKEWELINVSEHTDVKDLICPFFLRNDDKNCFFMTHINGSDNVLVMPMYTWFVKSQLWYWDGNHIRDMHNGKYLSVSNSNVVTLIGSNVETNTSILNWEFKQHHLSPYNDSSVHVVKQPDGEIRLKVRNDDETQNWTMLFQMDIESKKSLLHCDNPDDREMFLITSEKYPCVVLTSVRVNERPDFIPFDDSIIADQLWWWKEGALVNLGTRLHLGYDYHSGEVVMVQSDSSNQRIFQLEFRSSSFFVRNESDSFKLKVTLNSEDMISLGSDYVGDTSIDNTFEILNLTDIQENMEQVVCTFFIRNNLYPCEYLTGKGDTREVMVEPLIKEMIEDQVWYWQGRKLIQAKTGLVLSKSESGHHLALRSDADTTWIKSTSNTVQEGSLISGKVWEVDLLKNGAVKLESSSYLPSQQWSFLRTEESLNNTEILECPAKGSEIKQFYFLRNIQFPCIILTATEEGEYLLFKHLDMGSVENQLWYKDRNNIINVGNGLALRVFSDGKVNLWHRLAFRDDQKWIFIGDQIFSYVRQSYCLGLTDYDDPLQLRFCKGQILSQQWEWVPMENIENMTCFYFIRNEVKPCEFLTGPIHHMPVSVKPLTDDQMENQMWYWNATRLIHRSTGLALTEQNGAIVLLPSNREWNEQQWEYNSDIKSINLLNDKSNTLTMNPNLNGFIFMKPYNQSRSSWKFFEIVSSLDNIDILFCPVEQSDPIELFFIINYEIPCRVLTAIKKGQYPEFKYFSEENLNHQLWFMKGEAIVNSETLLVLDINVKGMHIVLNDHHAFQPFQNWFKEDDFIVYKLNTYCVMEAQRGTIRIPILSCSKHGGNNQRWSFIPYDNSISNFENFVCLIFIQNRQVPCELLTGFGKDNKVRTRPLSEDLISRQIWFWNGDKLINAHTGLALDMEHSNYGAAIILKEKGNSATQNWVRDKFFIKSRANNNVLDLSVSNGDVVAWGNAHGKPNQQWYFVRKDDGLKNLDLLHCATEDNSHAYFLKSEEDPCPLLTFDGYNKVTRQKIDTKNPSKQLWLWTQNNIVHVETGKALSLGDVYVDGVPVNIKTRYAFEPYQKWDNSNGQIRTLFRDQSKVLDFYNDDLRIHHKDGTNSQIWTWLKLVDVNRNEKLLRCLRCYNEAEETAAEVIGFIPILSTLYNLIRAAVYAGKKCNEVAWEAMQSALIDIAIDLIVVLSGGLAAAAVYGIKEGIKLGVKAGLKAMATAIKASIKVSINTMKVGVKTVFKAGLRRSIKHGVKMSILSAKNTIKSSFMFVKNIPIAARTVLFKSSKKLRFTLLSVKGVSTILKANLKKLHMIRKTKGFKTFASTLALSASKTGKSLRTSISKKMTDIGKSIRSKVNEIFNNLAERAEKNVILEKNNFKDFWQLARCKRTLGVCILHHSSGKARKEIVMKSNDDVRHLFADVDTSVLKSGDVFSEDIATLKAFTGGKENPGGQYAIVSMKNPDTGDIYDVSFISINDIRNADPRPVPLDANLRPLEGADANFRPDANVQHAEQFLLETKLNIEHLEKCRLSKDPCEIILYTKYSPCISHGNANALSCIDYLTRKCTELSEQYNTKCIVGFDKWWGDSSPWLDDVEVKKALSGDVVARENIRAMGVYDGTFGLIDSFLLKHENKENVREIFLELFKDTAMGENRYYSIYKTDFGQRKYPFSDIERQQLTTVWTDVNKLPDTFTNLLELKESIQESFNTKFGETLKKIEVDTVEEYMQDVNSFLKENPTFDDKRVNIELFRNIEDKNLQKKLKDWYKKGKPENLDDFKTEIRTTITEHFDLIRGLKTEYSSKAFSTYLEDTFGEAISRVLREELAIKKTLLELQKITINEFIEFVHLT